MGTLYGFAADSRYGRAVRPGEPALLRSVYGGRVRWAIPHLVVDETPELAALYVPPGTRGRRPRRPFIEDPSQLRTLRWNHVEHVWHGSHALRLLRPGAAHCLYLFWAETDWAFEGWYVNLQAPFRRTPISFDTRDHALDIVVEPDGGWRWKDEDHLELATSLGAFTAAEAAEIRAEGERVIAEWPFPTGWEDWRPEPAWPTPNLPDGWDAL
jgi:uncharacterized protein